MKNIVELYRPDLSFWDIVPEFITIEPTMGLYNSDKSKKKKDSSTLMWAIALLADPKSIFYNLPNKEEILARDHLKNTSFDWKAVENFSELYKDCILSQAEKSLIAWDCFMKKRDKFIKSQDLTLDHYLVDDDGANVISKGGKPILVRGTVDQLDAMGSKTAKFFADYAKVKKDIEDEQIKRGKGNKPKSLSDSNEI